MVNNSDPKIKIIDENITWIYIIHIIFSERIYFLLEILSLTKLETSKPKWVNTDYIQYGVSSLRLVELHIMRNLFVNINIMASNHPIQFEITTFFHKIPLFTQPEKNLDYCVWFKIFPYQIVLFYIIWDINMETCKVKRHNC